PTDIYTLSLHDALPISAMTTLIRRECFTKVGKYDEDLCFEDWDMWMRISRRFRFAYDEVPAAKYRVVSTSVVRTMSEAMDRSTEDRKSTRLNSSHDQIS